MKLEKFQEFITKAKSIREVEGVLSLAQEYKINLNKSMAENFIKDVSKFS
jgi:hypothetical protein